VGDECQYYPRTFVFSIAFNWLYPPELTVDETSFLEEIYKNI
jgi:hypothetical protein